MIPRDNLFGDSFGLEDDLFASDRLSHFALELLTSSCKTATKPRTEETMKDCIVEARYGYLA